MDRILLLLEQKENCRLLSEWLGRNYQVVVADDGEAVGHSFDLGIVDGLALDQLWKAVQARREAEVPVFLPFLLIASRRDVDLITRHLWRAVDELILAPIEKMELHARVEILLRARRFSLESEQRYYTLTQHSPVGICIVQDERLVYVNPVFMETSGRGLEQATGVHLLDMIHPENHEEVFKYYNDVMGTSGLPGAYEVRLRTPGGMRWAEWHMTSIIYRGRPAVLCILLDITERKRTEKALRDLSARLLEVQEIERRYIARELHDEVGQILTRLKLVLEMSERLPAEAPGASLGEAQTLINELMERVRDLSLNLRPSMLDDLGLLPALLWHLKRYTAQTHIRVTFDHTGLEKRRFASPVETAMYRIVQEALTNVARHADVNEATVRIWVDQNKASVHIEDHGKGFDLKVALDGTSSGLIGMTERARWLGGHLTIESDPGAGTRVMAELPLQKPTRKQNRENRT